MRILNNEIHIGIKEPFCVLHASDTHLTFADDRDCDRKIALANSRRNVFSEAQQNLCEIKKRAEELNCTVIYTGDLIDFVSELNLCKAKEFTDSVDCFMSAGNHEFSLFVGEAKEDAAYRSQSLSKVQSVFKNNIRCSSREINGVMFVAIDNSYYLMEEEQINFLKNECNKGLPVILCCHIPLYVKELYDAVVEDDSEPAHVMAVPEELMKNYSQHRYEQQLADKITNEAYDFIVNSTAIKAVLAGHLHKDYETVINNSIPQIITGVSSLREIYID